ncbi:coiled-coil domain-containing protein 62 isoform X1 [Triplophysa dalaica]|uniref:coiled-coil domain-containing protein 62 isoform X1 n=1 Tax=Triplophysa dalaica TaxID=1582913 RepID=UPI0024DF52F2|nr:coiled-coil domain-containing protein 62 isoform X1 [Triplophysa dalaica]
MDVDKEKRNSETLGNLSSSRGYPRGPWHSTPVKKNLFGPNETPEVSSAKLRDVNRTRLAGFTPQNLSKPLPYISSQDFQTPVKGLEISTMQRQRLELQLLIAELKDRDQELNAMAAAHQKQLLSWEQDRQRVLILEQRCARLEDELQKRNEMIRALSKNTKVVEAREKDAYRELNSTQQQLHELNQTQLNTSRHQQDLEEKNQSLNSTIMRLSSQVGHLQAREEELGTTLRLKDKDMIEATSHILELSGRLCELEKSLDDLRTRESKAQRETDEHKNCFRESRHENTQLKAELREKTMENNRQTEELIRLKQENQLLRKDLSSAELQLLNEDKSWKDELLELSRSKQARSESELLCLRQVCDNQQNDLQLLKLNLESVRETLRHQEGQRSLGRTDSGLGASHEIEYSDQQETEIDTGLISSLQNHSTGRDVPSDFTQHPIVEAETQTDYVCDFDRTKTPVVTEQAAVGNAVENNAKDTCALSQGTICEEERTEKENPAKENSCDESGNTRDIQTHRVYCEPGAGLDFVAVIDFDPDTGTPVCVVDVDVSQIFCATDLSHLHLDCPSPLPESGRGPSRLHESALCIEFFGNEEGYSSSTSRLQRLLAESREMVATLENSSGKPVSRTQSPTNTNAVCQPQSSHDNGSHHSQSSTASQEDSKRSPESDL